MSHWDMDRIEQGFAEAALNPRQWTSSLTAVAEEVGAYGAVLLRVTGREYPAAPSTPSLDETTEFYFANKWHTRDERDAGVARLKYTGVLDDFDNIDPDRIGRSPYYQEFLKRFGLQWYAGVAIRFDDELCCLSIQRKASQGPFSAEDKLRLQRLCHTLPSSVALSRALGEATGSGLLDAYEHTSTPAALINGRGEVIQLNASAERLLDGDVRIVKGRIVSFDSNATNSLDRALHQLIWQKSGPALGVPVHLPRRVGRQIFAYPARPPSIDVNPFALCRAVVVFIDPDAKHASIERLGQEFFHLTSAEARLASRLANGEELSLACRGLGISTQTGRQHLKSIFLKAGVNRQSDLVSLLQSVSKPKIAP